MKKKLKKIEDFKGITLIALVVTIVVLLILAAVSIGMLTGENGVITQAQKAKEQTEMSQIKEEAELCKLEMQENKYIKNESISQTRLILKLNSYFKDSYIQANRVVVWKEKYDVIVEKNLSIKVEKHKKVPTDDIGVSYNIYQEVPETAIIIINVIIGDTNTDYTKYANEILENKTIEEKEKIFLEGVNFWWMLTGEIEQPYNSLDDILKEIEQLTGISYKNLTELYEDMGFNTLEEFLIDMVCVKPEDFIKKMQQYEDILVEDENNSILEMHDFGVYEYAVNENGIYKFTISYQGIMKEIEVNVNKILKLEIELEDDTGKEALILQYKVENNDVIQLPYNITDDVYYQGTKATYDFVVDWGDGTKEFINNENIVEKSKHKYMISGTYDIKITGKYEYLSSKINNNGIIKKVENIDKLIKIKQWGTVGLINIDLDYATGLTEIACQTKSSFTNLRYIHFSYCSSLKELPDNLFANSKNILGASHIFAYCENLEKIGDNFLANNNIIGVEIMFTGCTKLNSVGKNMLYNCNKLTSTESMFKNCTNLTYIGENMLVGCNQLENAEKMFYNCTSLTNIDKEIFEYCRHINNFESTFEGCVNLEGNPIPLWDRVENGEENKYIGIPDGKSCYKGCTKLNDYNLIPEYWRDFNNYYIARMNSNDYYLIEETQGNMQEFNKAIIVDDDKISDISKYIQQNYDGTTYINLGVLVNNSVIEKDKKYILKIEKNGKVMEREVQFYNGPA